MRAFMLKLCLGLLCLSGTASYADTLTTFVLDGSFQASNPAAGWDLGTFGLSGTMTINTTTGVITAINFQPPLVPGLNNASDPYVEWAQDPSSSEFSSFYEAWASSPDDRFDVGLDLSLPGSLVGYTGGELCSLAYSCESPGYSGVTSGVVESHHRFDLDYGRLIQAGSVQTSPTPEPSSLALLGTGVLGVLGSIRRRK